MYIPLTNDAAKQFKRSAIPWMISHGLVCTPVHKSLKEFNVGQMSTPGISKMFSLSLSLSLEVKKMCTLVVGARISTMEMPEAVLGSAPLSSPSGGGGDDQEVEGDISEHTLMVVMGRYVCVLCVVACGFSLLVGVSSGQHF